MMVKYHDSNKKLGNTGGCEFEPRHDPTRDVESTDYSASGYSNNGKSSKRLDRRGTPKTGNSYNQSKRPSTGTTHRPCTRHNRKGSPEVKTHNINKHSNRARLQHMYSNHPPSSPTPNRVIRRSSQPTQPAAKHRRADPHNNTDTTRRSGNTQQGPCNWGPMLRSG